MAYYADLTPYRYGPIKDTGGVPVVNVGWLSRGEPFATGPVPSPFFLRLRRFCRDEYIVALYRGFHACELCGLDDAAWFAQRTATAADGHHWAAIGDGEMRAVGDGVIYAAPALVLHYVEVHAYQPPEAFVEAVLTGPQPGSAAHQSALDWWRAASGGSQ